MAKKFDPEEDETNQLNFLEALYREHSEGHRRGQRESRRWHTEVAVAAWAGILGLVVGGFLGVLAAHSVPDLWRWLTGLF